MSGGQMALLLNLYLGHLLGDFVLQPGWLVAAKRRGLAGLLIHVGIIGGCTAVIVYADLWSLWGVVLLSMAAHLGIEVITIKARASTALSGLSVLLVDQALHIVSLTTLVLLASSYIAPDNALTLGREIPPAVIAFACALIGVTFMGSIVVFELSNSVGPDSWNRDLLPFDAARMAGFLERGSALALTVFVHPALIVVPFLPRVAVAALGKGEERSRHMLVATSGLVVSAFGLAMVVGVALASTSL